MLLHVRMVLNIVALALRKQMQIDKTQIHFPTMTTHLQHLEENAATKEGRTKHTAFCTCSVFFYVKCHVGEDVLLRVLS